MKQLNRSETIPYAFRAHAIYEVDKALTDKELHKLIDKLNPQLRAVDEFDVGVDEGEAVGRGGRLVELDVDILEVAQVKQGVVGVADAAGTVGAAGEEHDGTADGFVLDDDGLVDIAHHLEVEDAAETAIVEDGGVEHGLAAVQAGSAVGIDEDVADIVDGKPGAVHFDLDGEVAGLIGGVDIEGDIVGTGIVETLVAEVGHQTRPLGGYLFLVVGVAGLDESVGPPAVEQPHHRVEVGIINHIVDEIALRGLDMVADADFLLADLQGVEGDGGLEAPLRLHESLQLLGGASRLVFLVDYRLLSQTAPIVAPEGVVART